MIAIALAAAALAASTTWTVDDDGPADFTQISEAIAQAASGDLILVEPGEYGPFDLDKRLTILARAPEPHAVARPHVSGLTRLVGEDFTIAGINFDGLRVVGVPGRGRIDDCHIGYDGDAKQAYALDVDGCAQVVVSRSRALGSKEYSASSAG
jgi:hypothetical protein